MKCEHEILDLKTFPFIKRVRIISKERNDFAKSRQQWIQAAFDIVYLGNDDLFDKLVEEELCDNCRKSYVRRKIN